MGTLSLYENAAVLTHQRTVRKDRRFHKAHKTTRSTASPYCVSKGPRRKSLPGRCACADSRRFRCILEELSAPAFHFLRVWPETKQRKRDEGGLAALIVMGLLLNSLLKTQGKIAMDGNFSPIAPWRALWDDPSAANTPPRLFSKSPIKITAANPPSSLFRVRHQPPLTKENRDHPSTIPVFRHPVFSLQALIT